MKKSKGSGSVQVPAQHAGEQENKLMTFWSSRGTSETHKKRGRSWKWERGWGIEPHDTHAPPKKRREKPVGLPQQRNGEHLVSCHCTKRTRDYHKQK